MYTLTLESDVELLLFAKCEFKHSEKVIHTPQMK